MTKGILEDQSTKFLLKAGQGDKIFREVDEEFD